jgi:MFS family permease
MVIRTDKTNHASMRASQAYWSLLRNSDYRFLWLGQTFSIFGESLYQIAFYWLAYRLSSGPEVAGLVVSMAGLPYLLFGLIGGAIADRWNRKRIMVICDVLRALAVATVPILGSLGALEIWHLGLVAFMLTSLRCFFYPALNASVTGILSDQDRQLGISFVQAGFRCARLMGVSLGGVLIALWGADKLYAVSIATFLWSALLVLPLRRYSQSIVPEHQTALLPAIIGTLRFMRGERDLLWSIGFYGLGLLFLTGVERIALPDVADQVWHAGPNGYAQVLAMISAGQIVTALAIGHRTLTHPARIGFYGWALWGVLFTIVGLATSLSVALISAFGVGIAEAMVNIPVNVLIQTRSPPTRLGKVFSLWSTIGFAGEALSAGATGLLIAHSSIAVAFALCGGATIIMASAGLAKCWSIPPRQIEHADAKA